MFDRFTDRAKKSMNCARLESQRLGHEFLGTEHLLLGVLAVETSTAVRVLEAMNVDLAGLRAEVERLVTPGTAKRLSQLPFTQRAKDVFERSLEEARGSGHKLIGTEHILLALIQEDEGVAATALKSLGVDLAGARAGVARHLGSGGHDESGMPLARGPLFERFTDAAKKTMNLLRLEAQRYKHAYLGTEHILLGLAKSDGIAAKVLANMRVDIRKIRSEIEKIIKAGSATSPAGGYALFTPRAKRVLEISMEEADKMADADIATQHLLLGLIQVKEGVAAKVLAKLGVKLDSARKEVSDVLAVNPKELRTPTASRFRSRPRVVPDSVNGQVDALVISADILRRHGEHDLADALERFAKRLEA